MERTSSGTLNNCFCLGSTFKLLLGVEILASDNPFPFSCLTLVLFSSLFITSVISQTVVFPESSSSSLDSLFLSVSGFLFVSYILFSYSISSSAKLCVLLIEEILKESPCTKDSSGSLSYDSLS
uniref:Uncharacterized protein n=1 Tax=Cacopsylla melanoneura TaxID=428564 RepID=A0A8D8R4G6_9HEMI